MSESELYDAVNVASTSASVPAELMALIQEMANRWHAATAALASATTSASALVPIQPLVATGGNA